MCPFHYFAKKAPEEALRSRIALEHASFARSTYDAHERRESFAKVESYLFAKHAADVVIV